MHYRILELVGEKMRGIAVVAALIAFIGIGAQRSQAQNPVKIIEVHAKRFAFSPSEITLKKGETVDLRIISEDVTHSLVVKDLNISQEISKGHPADIRVTPQSIGDFHGQCGHFCGSGHGKMTFTIHVTD